MQRFRDILFKHKYAICFFVFNLFYQFVIAGNCKLWAVRDATYSHHAVDFSVGFCSKLLTGAISNWLFHPITRIKVTVQETVMILLVFAVVSLLLERLMIAAKQDVKTTLFLFIFLFLTGTYTFSVYTQALGLMDAYWLYLTLLIIVLLTNKYLYLMIPFAAAGVVMIHYAAVICFVPFIAILLIYKTTLCKTKKEHSLLKIVTILTVSIGVLLSGYFALFERDNVKITMEEFDAMMHNRGVTDTAYFDEVYFSYYDRTFVIDDPDAADQPSSQKDDPFILIVWKRLLATFIEVKAKGVPWKVIASVTLIAPVLYYIEKSIFRLLKATKDKTKRFVFFCSMFLPFVVPLAGLMVSTDQIRWLSHGYLLFFSMFMIFVYYEKRLQEILIGMKVTSIPAPILISYFIIYASTVFHPYT